MEESPIRSIAAFEFKLDGENVIDALLLSKTIQDVAELTKLAAMLEDKDASIRMNVSAFKNGSFQIDFTAICDSVVNILKTPEAVGGLALTIISVVKGYIEIKKHLKGKEAKSVTPAEGDSSKIVVENCDGIVMLAPKSSEAVMKVVQIDNLTMNIAYYAQQHNPLGGFTITTPAGSVECTQDDVQKMAQPLPIVVEESTHKSCRVEAKLYIKKPALLGHSLWEFVYEGRAIKAKIEDEGFLESVSNGIVAMKAWDFIKATLKVENDFNTKGDIIPGTDKYSVLRVNGGIQHEKNHEQIMLPEEI